MNGGGSEKKEKFKYNIVNERGALPEKNMRIDMQADKIFIKSKMPAF